MRKKNKMKKLLIVIILVLLVLSVIFAVNIISDTIIVGNNYNAASANASSNLISEYIKSGITIGGVEGTLEVLDTSDATATAADIAKDKTAYVDGEKITGTAQTVINTTRLTFSNHLYADGFTMGNGQSSGSITLTDLPYSSMSVVSASYASATYTDGTLKITFDTGKHSTGYKPSGWPQVNLYPSITIDLIP